MVGHKAAHWSPYDFTPINLPRPNKKQPRSEAPRSHEVLIAVSPNTNPRRRTQALPDPSPNTEDDEREVQSFPVAKRLSRRGQPQVIDATRSFSPAQNRARGASRVPGIGDILGSFKQPEARPTFKEEPVNEDIMRLPLRKPTATRRRVEKTSLDPLAASKLTTVSRRKQLQENINRNYEQNNEAVSNSSDEQQNAIVDLTTDDERRPQVRSHDTDSAVQHHNGMPSYRAYAIQQPSHSDKIPETARQQVGEQYRQENIALPTNVKTWHQLEEFANRNQNPSRVTQAFLSQIRDFYITLGLTSHGMNSSHYQQSSLLAQGATQNRENRDALPHHNGKYTFGTQHPSLTSADRPISALNTPSEVVVKLEDNVQSLSHANLQRPLHGPANHNIISENRLRPRNQLQQPIFSNLPQSHDSGQSRIHNAQPYGVDVADVLTRPSDALLDILPSTTPSGHPHLVSLWDPDLLKMPTDQHAHLNLIDTVVSVIAKYDMKDESAIKAFLDTNEFPHFFFLFKSRTSAWHSWSIEREWDVVTIGLERNNRASNTAESTRPSSGQFDVTVIFKMDPSTPVDATPLATTISDPNISTIPTTTTIPRPLPAANDNLPTSQAPAPPTTIENPHITLPPRPRATVPGKWHLYGTTIFPAQPSLPTFLWSTPPNRGADDVSRYQHPLQTSLLPASHLSMLARYLQHTAFTCIAMEAEFQVAWGRKVRYDCQLGRVRATYDYALKGAKTQALKRNRGEYNRVPVADKKSGGVTGGTTAKSTTRDNGDGVKGDTTKKGGREERPGAGESSDWLAGRNGAGNVSTTGTEEAKSVTQGRDKDGRDKGRTHPVSRGGNILDGSVIKDTTSQTDMDEPPRKRPKKEREDRSGSEYMDSSDDQ